MTFTLLSTVYPTDTYDPNVTGAPNIPSTGVFVDTTLVAAILADAVANHVSIAQGATVSTIPPNPVAGYVGRNSLGPPTTGGPWVYGSIADDDFGSIYQYEAPTPPDTTGNWVLIGSNAAPAGPPGVDGTLPLAVMSGTGIDLTGATDSGTAAQAKLTASAGRTVFFPAGTISTSVGLTVPFNCSVIFDSGAVIKARSTISGPLLVWGSASGTIAANTRVRDQKMSGPGVLDCNGLAANGLAVPTFLHSTVEDVTVREATSHPTIFGWSTGEGGNELTVRSIKVDRTQTGTVPTGSYGVWVAANVADSDFEDINSVGSDVCFRVDGQGNRFKSCHGWGWQSRLPSVIFDDNGYNNEWANCEADTPVTYGFRMRGFGWTILGGVVFNGPFGSDNVVIGVKVDQGGPTASIVGTKFIGTSGHRIASETDAVLPNQYLTVAGCIEQNVATPKLDGDYARSLDVKGPLRLNSQRLAANQTQVFTATTAAAATRAATFTIDDDAMATFFPGRTYKMQVVGRDATNGNRYTCECQILISTEAAGTATATLCSVDNKLGTAFGLGAGVGTFGLSTSVDSATGLTLTFNAKNNGTNNMQFGFKLHA